MDTGIGLCGGGHDGLPFRRYMGAVIWGGVWYLGYTGGTVKYIKGHYRLPAVDI